MPAILAVNLVSVVLAGIAAMVLGFIWYGPLFGKKWMELTGKTMKDFEKMKSDMPKTYLQGFVLALITAYVLAHFVKYAGAATITDGVMTGVWVWLGFAATLMYGAVLWEGKDKRLFLLNAGYFLVNYIVMGAILAAMP
jgi:hypothetical protein